MVIGVLLLLGAAAVTAPAAAAAESVCAAPPYRAFDFWLGQWEVTVADGRTAGSNQIIREQGGCVLVERWQGVEGSTGMSLNFYDPAKDQWRQVWVSPETEIDIVGGVKDGSMVLEGTITYLEDRRVRPFRGSWTPLSDGRVKQFFEEERDDGQWTPWFEGFYRQVEQPAATQ